MEHFSPVHDSHTGISSTKDLHFASFICAMAPHIRFEGAFQTPNDLLELRFADPQNEIATLWKLFQANASAPALSLFRSTKKLRSAIEAERQRK